MRLYRSRSIYRSSLQQSGRAAPVRYRARSRYRSVPSGKPGRNRVGWRDSDGMARVRRSLPLLLTFCFFVVLVVPVSCGWVRRSAVPQGEVHIRVIVLRDGRPWSGSLTFQLFGTEQWNGSMAPYDLILQPGAYALTVRGGGPRNARLAGVTPAGSQLGQAGQTLTFTVAYTGTP